MEEVTTRTIRRFLEGRGIACAEDLSMLTFEIDGRYYEFRTDRLPMLTLIMRLNNGEFDNEALCDACREVTDRALLAKAGVTPDGDSTWFLLSSIEMDSRHFEACFDKYVDTLEEAANACLYYYNQKLEEKK